VASTTQYNNSHDTFKHDTSDLPKQGEDAVSTHPLEYSPHAQRVSVTMFLVCMIASSPLWVAYGSFDLQRQYGSVQTLPFPTSHTTKHRAPPPIDHYCCPPSVSVRSKPTHPCHPFPSQPPWCRCCRRPPRLRPRRWRRHCCSPPRRP